MSFRLKFPLLRKKRKRKLKEVKLPFMDESRPWYLEDYIEKIRKEIGEPELVDKIPPEYKFKKEFNVIYPVGNGIFIHVTNRSTSSGYSKYNVIEPPSPPKELLRKLEEAIARNITEEDIGRSADERIAILVNLIKEVTKITEKANLKKIKIRGDGFRIPVTKRDYDLIIYHLIRNKVGVGILEPFLRDPYIEDISCSGIGSIYIVHKIFGSLESNIGFDNEIDLNRFLITLAEKIGKPLSHARPVVDATLPDGSRINIVYGSDVSLRGSNFTIRRVSKTPLSIIQLIKWGTFDARIAAYMWMLLSEGMSVFVCGETASGKTTSLTAMLTFIRPTAKIVSIEDTAEVIVPHPNWTRELTRDTGKPESSVTMFDLLKAALRQRPNYIIVGEIRGAEGNIAFQAMQSVTWDTPILIKDGKTGSISLLNIGEFVDDFYDSSEDKVPKIIKGYLTLTLDRNGQLKWAPIKYVLRHKATDEVYEIIHEKGYIRTTGSHSVFVLDLKDIRIKPKLVSKLKPGDLLVVPAAAEASNKIRDAWLNIVEFLSSNVKIKYPQSLIKLDSNKDSALLGKLSKSQIFNYLQPLHNVSKLLNHSHQKLNEKEVAINLNCLGKGNKWYKLPFDLRTLPRRIENEKPNPTSNLRYYEITKQLTNHFNILDTELDSLSHRLELLLRSDVSIVEIIKVRKINYDGFVYDLSVPETELFFGGRFPVALHNTGHPVMSTFHAADIDRLIQRLTSHPINVPKTHMDALNVAWFQSAVYTKEGFLARRVIRIYEIIGYDPSVNNILVMPVFNWDPINDKFLFSGRGSSYLLEEKIAVMRGISRKRINEIYEEMELRAKFLETMVEKRIFNYWDVWKAVVKASQLGIEKAHRLLRRDELI
jgi:flagellar protein FlaI